MGGFSNSRSSSFSFKACLAKQYRWGLLRVPVVWFSIDGVGVILKGCTVVLLLRVGVFWMRVQGFGFLVWWCLVSCTKWRGVVLPRMAEDINVLLEILNFLEEEWIKLRIFNIPLEYMDKQVAIDVGKAIGEVVAIDWRDSNGKWTEYIRVRVKIDVLKPLRRAVYLVRNDDIEIICVIKYECLPAFCHICGLINHTTQKHDNEEEQDEQNLQYGSWLRASVGGSTQARSN
ncbi:hypothetical protein J1N35_023066 [Gossypium stocksii]|uniref:Zinc knuckle CX2CX4HX4C domain-containing protein n=1 Tax=Gossypium stocksii TaxID=47602 RepID=A0A9D4A3J2_9ROSI|nr:hypothetical protein J1N35_023066 [Gossypium stocksii]